MEKVGTCVLKRYVELKSQTTRSQPLGWEKGRPGDNIPATTLRASSVLLKEILGNISRVQIKAVLNQ